MSRKGQAPVVSHRADSTQWLHCGGLQCSRTYLVKEGRHRADEGVDIDDDLRQILAALRQRPQLLRARQRMRTHDLTLGLTNRAANILVGGAAEAATTASSTPAAAGPTALSRDSDAESPTQVGELLAGRLNRRLRI